MCNITELLAQLVSSVSLSLTLVFRCLQQSAAVNPWIQDLAGSTWWSGTTTPQPIPALSSGLEAVEETATSSTPRRSAEKPASRSKRAQRACSHEHNAQKNNMVLRLHAMKFTSSSVP